MGLQAHFEVDADRSHLKPEHGKLQFYIDLIDDKLRQRAYSPTLGCLICGSRNEHTV